MRALVNLELDPFAYYPRLRRVKQYVDKHLSERIVLREVAAVAGLEDKYFSTYFRTKVGVPFMRWLGQRRVAAAMELFAKEEKSVSMAAHEVGFDTTRTFQRTFKRVAGVTPSVFKQEIEKYAKVT